MRNRFEWLAVCLRVLLLPGVGLPSGCVPSRMVLAERGPQAFYQTAYPVHDTSRELARAFESVKQVSFTGEYVTYVFAEASGVTEADVLAGGFEARADTSYHETQSKAGTATILARSGTRVALLTANHVAEFQPVRIRYYEEEPGSAVSPATARRVAMASVLVAERGILIPHPGRGFLEVLARDERADLALLSMELGELSDTARFRPLALRPGDPRRLTWGSFVYVLGFPSGYRMVTRGIVSNPDWDGRGGFVTDGLWNEGISGGLILAVRGETGNLEAVALARAGAAGREVRLQPDTTGLAGADNRRYDGALYVESVLRIQYGITLPIAMTAVIEFLDQHRAELRTRGFDLTAFRRG